jgi:hypothetical protein
MTNMIFSSLVFEPENVGRVRAAWPSTGRAFIATPGASTDVDSCGPRKSRATGRAPDTRQLHRRNATRRGAR